MKKSIIILSLLFSSIVFSQEQAKSHENKKGELNLESNSGKIFQGAFIGAATYFTLKQFAPELDERNSWIKIPISIATAYLFEVAGNSKKTNTEKQLFASAGALSVTVTFEIFKGRR